MTHAAPPRPASRIVRLLALSIGLWLTPALRADVVHLKDGSKVEGEVVSESSTTVQLKTRFGVVDIARSRIERVEKKRSPRQEYEARLAALAPADVTGMFELSKFCTENRLEREGRKLLEKILRIDPEHAGAHEGLGHLEYRGKWYTKEDLAKLQAKEKLENEALGLVLHEGKWMTPEEAMVAQGYERIDGEWLSKEEAENLRAEREFESVFGVPLTISNSEHFTVRNTRTQESNQYYLDLFEEAYAHFLEIAQPDETELKFFEHYKFTVYILDDPTQVHTFVESGYLKLFQVPKGTELAFLDTTNFSYFFPKPLIVLSEGRHLVSGDDREVALTGMGLVHLGQIFLRRLRRAGRPPSWAEAGMAHYFEGLFNGERTVSVVEYPDYEPYVDKWIEDWETFPLWREKLSNPSIVRTLPSLRQMMETPVEELRVDALAKSWSLVSFLVERHRAEFFAFVRSGEKIVQGERFPSAEAFEQAFAPKTVEDIESEWLGWVKDQGGPGAGPKKIGILR